MDRLGLALDAVGADAGNPRQHAGEELGNHRPAQTDRLEVEAAAIRGDHRNPHLGHDLEQTRVDGTAIAVHRLVQRAVQQTLADPVGQAVLRQIGVHGCRAASDQHREVMRVDTFGRPHIDRTEGPQTLACQPGMHGRRRKDHRHRNLVLVLHPVGQHDMPRTGTHGVFGLGPDPGEVGSQRSGRSAGRKSAVKRYGRILEMFEHGLKLGVADEG